MAEEDGNLFNLTPVEFSRYFAYFHRITPHGSKLSGGRAREFFLQTHLHPKLLSTIWKLSDIDDDGCLNSAEFPLAMFLVQQTLRGVPIPLYLPEQLHKVYIQVVNPQLPVATDAHLAKCKKAFEAFRQNIGRAVLGGDAARYLLSKSNLTKGQLYHIWKLSDMDEDGHLTFKEFTVAMHLLFIAKLGHCLPVDLDPNTILPPRYQDIIRQVQLEAERLPTVDPDQSSIEPFSPPATPVRTTPLFGENPFISDEFVNLPARRFREGEFEDFYGDPFESVEIFSESVPTDPATPLQQFQVNTGSEESISQASQTHSHSSGMENEEPEIVERHDYYRLETPSPTKAQTSLSDPVTQSHDQDSPSHDQSHDLSQTSSVIESGSEKSSPQSSRSGRSKKTKSSVESLQDVVVTEREEPVLQLAKPVDVIGSREVTPVPEEADAQPRWVSPGQVQAELDELARASKRFLEESKYRLQDQQRRNHLPTTSGAGSTADFGMDKLKAASRKGLTATIKEMQEDESLSNGFEKPVSKSSSEQVFQDLQGELESVEVKGDALSHLENLEAEIWAALDDTEDIGIEATDSSTTDASVGVAVGGAIPDRSVVSPKGDEKVEVTKSSTQLEGNKKIKVTSVQVNIRRSSRSDDSKPSPSQSQPAKPVSQDPKPVKTVSPEPKPVKPVLQDPKPVKHILQDPKPGKATSQAGKVREQTTQQSIRLRNQERDAEPVKLRRPRELPAKSTVKDVPVVKKEKTVAKSNMEARRSYIEEEIMVDIDSFLEGELASINEVLEQFQTDDQKAKKRNLDEEKMLQSHGNATDGAVLPEVSVEEISRRRQIESQNIEEQWEAEMKRLEEERLQALQREEELKRMIDDDEVVQNLDKELQTLIMHEEQLVKETQKEKELQLKREEEERERKEKEKRERKMKQAENQQEELTVEEWIAWMEEKKKQGMTPEQQAEYERRKKAHLEKEKEREIKRQREIEEKVKKTREMMLAEQQAFSQRDGEVKSSRITSEELKHIQEENARKEALESQQRKERAKKNMEEMKKREMEEATPKARSALAARWEEKIKSRTGGKISTTENKTTVMSDSLEREKQRMARIISPSSQNGDESS